MPIVIESEKSKVSGDALSIGFGDGQSDLNVVASLGEHFILWEWVTALLCRALNVDPFNQPNVTEAKERTGKLLELWGATKNSEDKPSFESDNLKVYSAENCSQLSEVLRYLISSSERYLAIMAYLNREEDLEIVRLREAIAGKSDVGVTFGWGPRFLHSTGQFHKGGSHNGAFLQITAESESDIQIPGQDFSFKDLLMAQAIGDGQALNARGLPLVRIHLKKRRAGIIELLKTVEEL